MATTIRRITVISDQPEASSNKLFGLLTLPVIILLLTKHPEGRFLPMRTLRSISTYILPLILVLAWCGRGSAATVVGDGTGAGRDACHEKGGEALYGFAISRLNFSEIATIDLCTGGFNSATSGPVPFFANSFAVATQAGFLYISNSFIDGGSNNGSQIFVYSIDPADGSITQIAGSPFFLFPPPVSIQGLATTPDGQFLYGADASGNIFAFSLDKTTGVPTSLPGSPIASGPNAQLVVDPSGKFLYATSDDAIGSVLAYAIDSTGALTPVPGSPFVIASPTAVVLNTEPYGVVDTGNFLYVALTNQVAAFSVDSETGALTHVPGAPFPAGNGASFFATVNNFLYVVNAADGTVSAYAINPGSGALTPVPGSPFGSGGGTLAIDPSGKYLYLGTFKGVQGYDIDPATGALSLGPGTLGEQGVLWLTIVGRR
jgi:6-phosphogluconolactonase (cycloisomerase 2 family)